MSVGKLERSGCHQEDSAGSDLHHPLVPAGHSTIPPSVVGLFAENEPTSVPDLLFYQQQQQQQHHQLTWCFSETGASLFPLEGDAAFYSQPEPQPHEHAREVPEIKPAQVREGASQRGRSKSSGNSSDAPWDIKDSILPTVTQYDPYDLWPDGNCRRIYSVASERARRHQSGWAMRNTNNHNPQVLKKSCLGVLVCSLGCTSPSGLAVAYRPAICDKARKKQCMRNCTTPGCKGRLVQKNCKGHGGYPVTHFWRFANGAVFFQSKGRHDHVKPMAKALGSSSAISSRAKPILDEPVASHRRKIRSSGNLASAKIPLSQVDLEAKPRIASTLRNERPKHDEPQKDAATDFNHFQLHQPSELEALLMHHQSQQIPFQQMDDVGQTGVYFQQPQQPPPPLDYFLGAEQQVVGASTFHHQLQPAEEVFVNPHQANLSQQEQYHYAWRIPVATPSSAVETDYVEHQDQQHQQQQQPYLGMLFATSGVAYRTDAFENYPALPETSGSTDASIVSFPGGGESEAIPYPVTIEPPADWTVGQQGQHQVHHSNQHHHLHHHHQQQQHQIMLDELQPAWFLSPQFPWKSIES
ncbi:unnamed protein product [Mesocestoides corti]|uniref:GCM domain-containing protein n=1 Tax=Mesocestoides corti TaxID=53468 RepID=A0A0R3UIU7_MESCO|nr:unnamed protein product [Mesocestoides corti]